MIVKIPSPKLFHWLNKNNFGSVKNITYICNQINNNNMYDNDFNLFDNIKKAFQPKRIISVGDIGIYQDVLTIDTINDGTHTLKYDIYAKVRAKAIYENLVEIEVMDVITLNSCNQDIKGLVDANMPKYIKPKYVKWEVK